MAKSQQETTVLNERTSKFAEEHGEWTAMAIKLSDGSYTRQPAIDHRLRRLLQIAVDTDGKPISQCRVLDLACLEGHYAIEFGMHGAEALGIEGRAISVAKCNYVRDALNLDKVSFAIGDVRDFSAQKYGSFDIIICSGLLYHLRAVDAWGLIKKMKEACSGILIIDTFISLSGRENLNLDGQSVAGHFYHEHDTNESSEDKATKLWASLDNETSFWFTEPSLLNLLMQSGFTSVLDVLAPTMPGNPRDRKTYLAIAGTPARILTSDPTRDTLVQPMQEGINTRMDASQTQKSRLHLAVKQILPPSIKNIIKPPLRAIGILPPDPTPEFMKKREEKKTQ